MASTKRTDRILELDGLRAIGVLAVIIFHMWGWADAIPHTLPWANSLISCFGPTDVYVFFVISGFIITSMLIREYDEADYISLQAFYIRRFFRIIPPLASYIVGLLLLTKTGYITINPINYLWSLLFLGNFGLFDDTGGNFLAHTWSLSAEEQYYLIMPLVMVSVFRFRIRPINILLMMLFCISLASLTIAKVLATYIHPDLIILSTFFKFRYILVGVALALHRKFVQKIVTGKSVFLPLALLTFIFIIYDNAFSSVAGLLLNGIEPIAWGILVIWFVENPAKCAFLRWRVVQWIGSCSYSIYLWQQLFTNSASSYNGWAISSSPLTIIPIFIVAALCYYFVEKPSIQLGRYVSATVTDQRNRVEMGRVVKQSI